METRNPNDVATSSALTESLGPWVLSKRVGAGLQAAAGGWLQVAIVAAPWMYGCTRHWAIIRLCEMLTAMAACWMGGLLFERRSPALPHLVLMPALFLLISGWLVVLTGPALPPVPFAVEHFGSVLI